MPAGYVHSQTCWHCGQAALLTAWRQMRTGLRHPQILQVRVGGGKGLIMKDRKQEDIRLEPNYHNPHSGKAVPCEKWTTPRQKSLCAVCGELRCRPTGTSERILRHHL